MLDKIVKAATDLSDKVTGKSELEKVLRECTSNENWNVPNSKLQIIAEHSYNMNDYMVIMKHFWEKLNAKSKDWRKIYKSLNALDYLIKNGSARVAQDVKDDLFRIRTLQDFTYVENMQDKGSGGNVYKFKYEVRTVAKNICELLSDLERLEEERQTAQKNRSKIYGGPSTYSNDNYSTAAQGRYVGYGSKDADRYGYQSRTHDRPYDPYVKKDDHTERRNSTSKKEHETTSHSSSKHPDLFVSKRTVETEPRETASAKKESTGTLNRLGKPHHQTSHSLAQPPSVQQPNLLEMDIGQPSGAGAGAGAGAGSLIDFGGPAAPQTNNNNLLFGGNEQKQDLFTNMTVRQHPPQQQPNLFENMNVRGSAQPAWATSGVPMTNPAANNTNFFTPQQPPVNNNNMFNNMTINQRQPHAQASGLLGLAPTTFNTPQTQQPMFQPDTNLGSLYGNGGTQMQSTPNMFNGMQIQNRSPTATTQVPQSYQNTGFVQNREPIAKVSSGNTNQNIVEDFSDFQSSKRPENRNDAWSMGKGLFTLDLKADAQQKSDKQKSTNDDLLFTKNQDMNSVWSHQNPPQRMPTYPTSGGSYYTANTSNTGAGYGGFYNNNPMGGPSMSPGFNSGQPIGQAPGMPGSFGGPSSGFGGSSAGFGGSSAFGFTNPSASGMPNTGFQGSAGVSNFAFMSGNLGAGGNQRSFGGPMM